MQILIHALTETVRITIFTSELLSFNLIRRHSRNKTTQTRRLHCDLQKHTQYRMTGKMHGEKQQSPMQMERMIDAR